MATHTLSHRSRRGQMLIGMIIVIAIILAMTAYSLRPHGVVETAYQRGQAAPCGIYTGQIREAIMMYKQDNGSYPPDLASLKKQGVVPEMYAPPCTYGYDPSTGALTPPSSAPGAPPPPGAISVGTGGTPPSPGAQPAPGPNGGGGTYIPPMAGTVGIHIPGSVTGGGPSNQKGAGESDNN